MSFETPENGRKGLRHWRHDIIAGFMVAMISTPFSIGIAVASGAPPITGLTSAIIAGLVLPFLGGSFVTISGPAAGLAPALYGAMLTLGAGNLQAGYPLLLPCILLAGIIQLILSHFKAARFSAFFPVPVVEGMLASIGLMIIAKQLPTLLGHTYHAHEFWSILLETPQELRVANWTVMGLGLATLAVIVILNAVGKGHKWAKILPPQILAVGVGTLFSTFFLHLAPEFLIHIPENPFVHGITFPDFAGLLGSLHLWTRAIAIAVTLTLIDGIESLATIDAIDKIDPYHRKSNPDKTLFAMGVSNICSSIVGGLTIIPGGVKSTANIMAGGRTQWANFFNACFLLLFLLFFHRQISTLPLAVLSAVLVYTGFKLCQPAVWSKMSKNGWEQLTLFSFTVLVTLTTDLMWGIISGVAFAFLLNLAFIWETVQQSAFLNRPGFLQVVCGMFQNPITGQEWVGREYHLLLGKPLISSNYLHMGQALANLPEGAEKIVLHITQDVVMIDYTTMDNLNHWIKQHEASGGMHVELRGMDQFRRLSDSDYATHLLDLQDQQITVAG